MPVVAVYNIYCIARVSMLCICCIHIREDGDRARGAALRGEYGAGGDVASCAGLLTPPAVQLDVCLCVALSPGP